MSNNYSLSSGNRMNVLLLLVAWCLVVVVQANESSWNAFQIKNSKVYKNQAEMELRKKIFNENLQMIEEHNQKYEQGLVSYKLGINKFADLTHEEFGKLANEIILRVGDETVDLTNNGTREIPQEIDWRTQSVVTRVKDQGSCGSCWAFSATGTLESQVAIKTGELLELSEQQLVDCDVSNNKGCIGGNVQEAFEYVKYYGLTLEGNYPYRGVQGLCSSTARKKNATVWIKGYVNIARNNETDLKQAVGLVGPVSVAINSRPIQFYEEGIFNSACSAAILDHAVLAVGYGIDNKTKMEYWIMKNSWGTDWGDQGYFKLQIGRNLCGVAKYACYPILRNSGFSINGGIFTFLLLSLYLFLY